jgi:tRNA (cytidine56-2'-O)-methyltransferase
MITVLRLGHRPLRDKRITTHVCLVARAFGADGVIVDRKDESLRKSIEKVTSMWGGTFAISFSSPRKIFAEFPGMKVHLTMYGLPLQDVVADIRGRDTLVIVGAEKVPGWVYESADYNVSVTSQPHSEVAALALFLDRYFEGKELNASFNGKLSIVPSRKGKLFKK